MLKAGKEAGAYGRQIESSEDEKKLEALEKAGKLKRIPFKDRAEMAKLVRIENFKNRMLISPDLDEHRAQIQQFADLGFDEIHVHNVGRNQEQFVKAFGEQVIPKLH